MYLPVALGNTVYDMANTVFGSGMAKDLNDWMDTVFVSMKDILNGAWTTDVIRVLVTVGCSFLIIYYFADLLNQASKDMFTFEKMVIGFIRILIAFALLLFIDDIIKWIPEWISGFKEIIYIDSDADKLDAAVNTTSIWSGVSGGVEKYKDYYNHLVKTPQAIGAFGSLTVPYLISMFAELMGKFVIASTAVMLLVRAMFAPVAVVQIFEDGTRSAGIRYLKGLLAEGLSFACILAIILAANQLAVGLSGSISGITEDLSIHPELLNDVIGFKTFVPIMIPKLVIAGGMASGSKIAHDIMGA